MMSQEINKLDTFPSFRCVRFPELHIFVEFAQIYRAQYGAELFNFNISKCYHLGITNKVVPFSYNYLMNDIVIAKSASTKYLGVTISHNLNWNQHCDNICSKANSMLGLLRRVLSDCSMDVKSKAYTTLVRPQLEYACSVWNPYTKRNIRQIELVQHKAARFVFRDYSNITHVTLPC